MNGKLAKSLRRHAQIQTVGQVDRAYNPIGHKPVMSTVGKIIGYKRDSITLAANCTRKRYRELKRWIKSLKRNRTEYPASAVTVRAGL